MKKHETDICNLNLALVGCITDNLLSASFDYVGDKIQLKLIYRHYTEIDSELEDDIVTDFCALSGYMDHNFVADRPIAFYGADQQLLKYKVYVSLDL